jgi:hypothetical protein
VFRRGLSGPAFFIVGQSRTAIRKSNRYIFPERPIQCESTICSIPKMQLIFAISAVIFILTSRMQLYMLKCKKYLYWAMTLKLIWLKGLEYPHKDGRPTEAVS